MRRTTPGTHPDFLLIPNGARRDADTETILSPLSTLSTLSSDRPIKLREHLMLHPANLKEATSLIVEKHYLHRGRTMAQIAYWILFDGTQAGIILFALPRLSVIYQGYGPMQLIELARLWIDPDMQNLRTRGSDGTEHSLAVASCAIGMALRRIRQDWYGKYPHMPLIRACVSWSDDTRHEGTIYRAANFEEIGKSGGTSHGNRRRANGGRDAANPDYLHVKTAFIYRYRRPLSEKKMARARSSWARARPRSAKHRRPHATRPERQLDLKL